MILYFTLQNLREANKIENECSQFVVRTIRNIGKSIPTV